MCRLPSFFFLIAPAFDSCCYEVYHVTISCEKVLFLEDFRAALELHDTTLKAKCLAVLQANQVLFSILCQGHQSFSAAASPASRASPASVRGSHESPVSGPEALKRRRQFQVFY